MNIAYLHNPIKNVEHFKIDRAVWSQKWEDFFSLGKNELQLRDFNLNELQRKHIKYPSLLWKRKNTIFDVSNCHHFLNAFPNCYYPFLTELKEIFWKEKLTCRERNSKVLQIAIHLRRGDVEKENINSGRFTSNDFIIEKLDVLVDLLKEMNINYKVLICSQGAEKDFCDLRRFNPILKINEDEFSTFLEMVKSDVLIMAKSSFSYLAALLNSGIILYEPFWHQPLPSWIDLSQPNDNLDHIFQERLSPNKDKD